MKLVIVESPAKAKTINKYLGKDYEVIASFGHIRDLPSKDGSVLPDEDFAMSWAIDSAGKKRIADISKALVGADELILATDPDREGEAISWHVLDVLNKKKLLKGKKIQRVVFNSITKKSVLEAMAKPRELDIKLVNAYLARRALDYLVGFTLSPILWRKLPGSRSAGRVQSVALRLVCDRELEIEKFKPQEYWNIDTILSKGSKDFEARLYIVDGKKIDRLFVENEAQAKELKTAINSGKFIVSKVEKKPTKRNPYAPFTTSSLQQDASSRLGFSPSRTMQIAQKLYEGINIGGETVGLITYMRTDAINIAPEAIAQTREAIAKEFGNNYLPSSPRIFQSKAKNVQEAHEAIRPTNLFRHPEQLKNLEPDQLKLYTLIWKRTMASQMKSAEIARTTVDIKLPSSDKEIILRAVGSEISFPGHLALMGMQEIAKKDEEKELPPLQEGDEPKLKKCDIEQSFTKPPARFTEASLIKKMEELGIGRPSTYASTISVLQNRDYVRLEKRALIPEDRGRLVTAFLENFFTKYVAFDFTADLEKQLDDVASGDIEYKQVLQNFWKSFSAHTEEIKDLRITQVLDRLNEVLGSHIFPAREDGSDPRSCPTCKEGQLSLKLGRYGAFIGCSNYPECNYTAQLSESVSGAKVNGEEDNGELGIDPESGEIVYKKSGRFGHYVQLGEQTKEKKAKRTSIPKGWDPQEVDLEKALQLLSLPREIGAHPEDGKMIIAGLGRYGPFINHNGIYANLSDVEELFSVGINRCVDLLAEKAANGGRRGASTLKELGDHPDGGKISVKDGRYGPYVNHGKINATLPKDIKPEEVTLEQALELIAKKAAAKGKKRKTAPKKKSATKKTTTKKKVAKKPAAKK